MISCPSNRYPGWFLKTAFDAKLQKSFAPVDFVQIDRRSHRMQPEEAFSFI
jgi:hypothetical protein